MQDKLLMDIEYENDFLVPYLKQFRKYLPRNATVLELGCGKGINTKKMSDLGCICVGVSESISDLEVAKRYNPSVSFFLSSLDNDLSTFGLFDGVLLLDTLARLKRNTLESLFTHIFEVLKEDGVIFIMNRNEERKICKNGKDVVLYAHSQELLELAMMDKFFLVEELIGDEHWRFFIYQKKNKK